MTNKSDQAGIKLFKVLEAEDGLSVKPGDEQDELLMLDLKHLRDVIFIENINFQVVYVSPAVTLLFGYTGEEMKTLEKRDYLTPDSLDKATRSYRKYLSLARKHKDVDVPLMEYEYIRKDGSTFWGELKVSFIRNAHGELIGTQGILRNIDDRKKMEKCLEQSDLKFHTIFDMSPQAIALTQLDTGILIDVNEKFCELTQYSKDEVIGKTTTDIGFYTKKMRAQFIEELAATGEVRSMRMDFKAKDGAFIHSLMYAKVVDVENEQLILTVFYNRTTEIQLEQQFLQAQKMESIGTLAGSVAHDFNNFIMSIQGYVSLMLKSTEPTHRHYQMLCAINEQVQNCTQLTRRLLGYARKGDDKDLSIATVVDLNQLIEETSASIKGAIGKVDIRHELESGLWSVQGDPVQIKQALYNLYINADDAMPEGGRLSIRTSNVTHREMAGRAYSPKKEHYVSILVADTGTGMDQKTMEQVFEPFFTTKKQKGTGLGLASVYGIIKGHAGYIDVASEPGKGTSFNIFLPASEKPLTTPLQNIPEPEKTDTPVSVQGTVLFADDDNIIREVASRMLEKVGLNVEKAANGQQAIDIFKKKGTDIDLVILDFMMPDMDANEVFEQIKKIKPDAKILISSGYDFNQQVSDLVKKGCLGFIQKPFDIDHLSVKISEIIARDK